MITISASPMMAIRLGRIGENERQRVAFDVSALLAELPGASFTVINQGPGDAVAYPCPGVTVEDGVLYWPITSAELEQTGRGRCELIVTVGDVVAKSVIYSTQILEALDGSGETPSEWETWQTEFAGLVADAQTAAAAAESAAESAEASVVHGPRIEGGVWYVWDGQSGEYVSTEVRATGPAGDDGISPTVTVTDIAGGHRITITDKDGAHSFDVMDGDVADAPVQSVNGQTGAVVLDAADVGAGTYSKPSGGIPASDLAAGVIPTVPVQDVQVNGTSVLDAQGVANMPMAGNAVFGAVKIGSASNGIEIDSSGYIKPVSVNALDTKAGTNNRKPVTAAFQHQSTFYGLAKAAGDTTQSQSSNAVGAYTDDAKIAIQKMLGIYQPPWELLNDITLTEEGRFDLTADDNGTPYDLLGVYIRVVYAANLTAASTGYGRYLFEDSNGVTLSAETGKYSAQTSQYAKFIYVIRNGTMAIAAYSKASATGGALPWNNKDNSGVKFDFKNIQRIYMNTVDIEPAGARIQIYGQRAY